MTEQHRGFDDPQRRDGDGASALSDLVMFSEGLKLRRGGKEELKSAEQIGRTLDAEMIPRLMMAYRLTPQDLAGDTAGLADVRTVGDADRALFLEITLKNDVHGAKAFIAKLLERGVARDDVYLDLLASTARSLGELWDNDERDFTDVTIGLCLLHQILREDDAAREAEPVPGGGGVGNILLTTVVGDLHIFGLIIVADFFRRAGWRVWCEPGLPPRELNGLLARSHFDVIGLSAAVEVPVDVIADEIASFRESSCNSDVKVFVGGRLFAETPGLVAQSGADGFTADAKTAPLVAAEMLAASAYHC